MKRSQVVGIVRIENLVIQTLLKFKRIFLLLKLCGTNEKGEKKTAKGAHGYGFFSTDLNALLKLILNLICFFKFQFLKFPFKN